MFLIILLTVLCLTFIYLWGRYNQNYWKKRGVAFYDRNKVLGVVWDFFMRDKAVFEALNDVYKLHGNEPAVGIGSLFTPTLYVMDPENIQHIVQTDFQAFSHRAVVANDGDLLADNLLFMNGPRWKLMRQRITPLFTAAKLRNMYYIIDKSAQDFVDHLREHPYKLKGNGYETINEFCSAAIAAAVFGIGTESTFKSPFLQMARDAVRLTFVTNLRFGISNVSEKISKYLGIKFFKEHEEFFIGAVKQILRARERERVNKHDFAEICLSLQEAGTMRDKETGLELEPTDELLAAQGFFFFIAGVEPAASTMFGALVELGKRPEMQRRVQQEIDETYKECDGDITYDVVSKLKYLDQVLNETLRVHTPIGFSNRKCVRDSVLPVGNIKVSKGTKIFIPIYDMHFDPKYFPEPEEFDPERFSPKNRSKNEFAFVPFGRGNRICIGMRYIRLQILAGLVHLLRNYDVVSSVDVNSRKYAKGQFQVRLVNSDIQLIPRRL